jgi:outer membrane protein OmpA-like peptidoglycan-associated protein
MVLATQGLDAAINTYRTRVLLDCLGSEQAEAARALALRHLPVVAAAEAADAAPADRLQLVRRGLSLDGTVWQLHEVAGDLVQAAAAVPGPSDFAAALADYQAALRSMTSQPAGQPAPAADDVNRVAQKAEQAALLSGQAVSGASRLDALAATTARSFTVVRVSQPVYFREGTADLTELGQQAAAGMLAMLRSRGMPRVRVIGHADSRGTVAANDRLSLARAQAVVRYLQQNGYQPGRATAEGRGSREPYKPLPIAGVTFTQDQRWQMDRRVEVVITP